MEKLLYSIKEASFSLGVSVSTISKMVSEGRIKTIKIGASKKIPASELYAIVNMAEKKPSKVASYPGTLAMIVDGQDPVQMEVTITKIDGEIYLMPEQPHAIQWIGHAMKSI